MMEADYERRMEFANWRKPCCRTRRAVNAGMDESIGSNNEWGAGKVNLGGGQAAELAASDDDWFRMMTRKR